MDWPLKFTQSPLTDKIQDNEAFKCKYITKGDPLGDGHFSTVKQCMNIHTKDFYAMKLIRKDIIKDKLQLIRREFRLLKYLSQQIRFLEHAELHSNNNSNSSSSGNNNKSNSSTSNSTDNNDNFYCVDTFQGHHHILQLFDYFETTANIVLITQLCKKDDLYEKIITSSHLDLSKQVVPYTACLISVLDFLHSQGVIHRDIKAENILFRLNKSALHTNLSDPSPSSSSLAITATTDNTNDYDLSAHDLILGDFGLALDTQHNNLSDMDLKEYVGTISYIAPEVVRCKGISLLTVQEIQSIRPYDSKIDIWALGVLVYFMATGYTPFDCETDEETLQCISNCDYYIDDTLANDPEYKDFWNFIQCCFIKDSNRRRSARTLKSHPFIKDFFAPAPTLGPSAGILQEDSNQLVNSVSVTGFPLLKKNKSLTSLPNLKKPPERIHGSSLFNYTNHTLNSNTTTIGPSISLSKPGQWTIGSDSSSNLDSNVDTNSNSNATLESTLSTNLQFPQPHPVHNHYYPTGLTPLTPFSPSLHHTSNNTSHGTADPSCNSKSNNIIRRTLSTTSLKSRSVSGVPNSLAMSSLSSGDHLTRGNATNSTFFLDPQPPKGSLMNGVFCESPESLSSFTTTPRSSVSLSRQNSHTNDTPNLDATFVTIATKSSNSNNNNNNSNNKKKNTNQYNLSRSASYTNVKKSCFQLEYEND